MKKPTQKGRLVVGYGANVLDLLSVPGGRGIDDFTIAGLKWYC